MPIALLAALASSLAIHAAALFGAHFELGSEAAEPPPLLIELKPPPAAVQPLAPAPVTASKVASRTARTKKVLATPAPAPVAVAAPAVEMPLAEASTAEMPPAPAKVPAAPVAPILPGDGVIRYVVTMGSGGFYVGRAEHRWQFTADGQYRLSSKTETSGLVALFRSLSFENESRGRLTADGLQPESYRSLKNGRDSNEGADFDWGSREVRLQRDGSTQSMAPGSQDILSLNYQLAYLKKPEGGGSIGVVTGKKYERYALDSLGEEEIDTPAGRFRTLHLRAMTESTTEIWIALDRYRLPVKIRFIDKKGDSFEQLVTEIGSSSSPAP